VLHPPSDEPKPLTEPTPEAPPGPPDEEARAPAGPALAVFAHPDDAEISSGGTLARWAREGREVHLLVLTSGDRGSEDPARDRADLARTRKAETEGAAAVLGMASTHIVGVHDGELENSPPLRAQIVRIIRRIRPTVVLSCDPTAWFFGNRYFNHADHRTAGAAALDAVFPGAGNPHFFAEQLSEGLQPWKVTEVWLGWTNEPNHYQDITGLMDLKLKALFEHRSQVEGDMLGFFEQWLPAEAEENGKKIGVQHAEAFRVLQLD
jgi:LmbE family N-acetylglucosaminyl deacetylase